MEKGKKINSFEIIYKQYAGGIFRFIYFKVSDYELTQDLTEETFIRYWKLLVNGENIKNSKALLFRIAKGKVFDHYRKKRDNKRIPLDKIDERLLGVIENSEDGIDSKQKLQEIFMKMKKIKNEYQDVLLLHYVEDLTVKEIAFIQNKKENAIRVFLHRALNMLKEII
jgi:RNA polymerase sigma-70 factor (ECF subfamily)